MYSGRHAASPLHRRRRGGRRRVATAEGATMSLTEAEEVFGGVHEDALNDVIKAFFGARPRYATYGSPAFVPATSVNATRMDPIPFPFVAGGIDWAVTFTTPTVDLHPESPPAP